MTRKTRTAPKTIVSNEVGVLSGEAEEGGKPVEAVWNVSEANPAEKDLRKNVLDGRTEELDLPEDEGLGSGPPGIAVNRNPEI